MCRGLIPPDKRQFGLSASLPLPVTMDRNRESGSLHGMCDSHVSSGLTLDLRLGGPRRLGRPPTLQVSQPESSDGTTRNSGVASPNRTCMTFLPRRRFSSFLGIYTHTLRIVYLEVKDGRKQTSRRLGAWFTLAMMIRAARAMEQSELDLPRALVVTLRNQSRAAAAAPSAAAASIVFTEASRDAEAIINEPRLCLNACKQGPEM